MEKLKLYIKGILLGGAVVIPGFSGGTLAIILGVYEKLISILANLKKELKKSLPFLIPIAIGMLSGIFLFSKVITIFIDKNEVAAKFIFIGLIIGGLPHLYKKVNQTKLKFSNILILLISFAIILSFVLLNANTAQKVFVNLGASDYFSLYIVGIVAAVTLILPGISGSLTLLVLGYYHPILKVISSFLSFDNLVFNLSILGVFALGLISGTILSAKAIDKLLKKYPTETYYAIIGIILASIVALAMPLKEVGLLISLAVGFIISYSISKQ